MIKALRKTRSRNDMQIGSALRYGALLTIKVFSLNKLWAGKQSVNDLSLWATWQSPQMRRTTVSKLGQKTHSLRTVRLILYIVICCLACNPTHVLQVSHVVPQYMRARKRGRYISFNTHIAKHKLSAAHRGAYIPDRGPYL